MSSLRSAIGARLPHRWTNRLRALVRGLDQARGLPLAPLRPGAVAMYHIGRCGSSVLGEMLDRHARVKWDREIYFHRWTQGNQRFERWDSEGFLRRRMWAAGRRWYGFEIKFLAEQHLAIVGLPLHDYLDEIRRAGVTHHIVLRRRNTLRRMISAEAGRRSGRRHATSNAPRSHDERVHLDVARARLWTGGTARTLVECLDDIARGYDELERLLSDDRVLHLEFEGDVALGGPGVAYGKACAFLGIAPQAVEPHTRRLHDGSVEDLVTNFGEVADALRGTPHEWMLGG